jgi:membrane-bound lytic murein transglycosylase A
MQKKLFQSLVMSLLIAGCARAPLRSPDDALRATRLTRDTSFVISDDLQFKDFATAIMADISRLKSFNAPLEIMKFGPKKITREQYINALQTLVSALQEDPSGKDFEAVLRQNFDFFEVYGEQKWADVMVTGYYEPIIKGALTKTKDFTEPIYGVPKDMVLVSAGEFNRAVSQSKNVDRTVSIPADRLTDLETPRLSESMMRGRLIPGVGGRIATVVPYFSREELTAKTLPMGSAPILAWVDPIDAFFLQIQGSGRIDLGHKKEIRVGYAEQNGRPYIPIGRALFDKIPREKMTRAKIVNYLRSISNIEAMNIMNLNPSFVFFQKLTAAPMTYFGTEVVPGRTIASDPKYFAKGAMAYLEFEKPIFVSGATDADDTATFQTVRRFVLDQDTGGAIRGAGHVDLFVGTGADAERSSGVMRHKGKLYYVVPK